MTRSHVGIIIAQALYSTQPKMAMRNTPRSRQGCMCSFHWLRESEANYDDWQRIIVTLMKSNWCSTLHALKCYSKKPDKKKYWKKMTTHHRSRRRPTRTAGIGIATRIFTCLSNSGEPFLEKPVPQSQQLECMAIAACFAGTTNCSFRDCLTAYRKSRRR